MRVRARARSEDRGDTLVEVVLITPIVFLIVFTVIQFALWYHARQIVNTAAQEGGRAARVATTSPASAMLAGRDRAYRFIETLGGSVVARPDVSVTRTATTVTVRVDATALAIVPGLNLAVHGRSVSPVERFEPSS